MVGKNRNVLMATVAACLATPVLGQVHVTEFMYSGTDGEYVEFTNVGASPVDMTGWSFDDNSQTPGSFDVSAWGIVAPGESVIITETATELEFETAWGLPASVKIVAGNDQNLGRSDEINLYDNNGVLVARLTYDDQTDGSPRTQNTSAWPCGEVLGDQTASSAWQASSVGDSQGSFTSVQGNVGSPGQFTNFQCAAPVPTVSEWGLAVLTLVGLIAGTVMFSRSRTVKA